MVATRKATTKKTTARKTTAGGKSKDPVDAYFQQQPPDKRILLEKLRALVAKNVPDAEAAIKWGVPIYQRNGRNICALAAFKDHVGLNFFASPDVLVDPAGKLEGSGKGSRMLKVRNAADIDAGSIQRWLKAAAKS
ncbi:MAG: DUF1801 domain-containing protein [Chloroflexi bacterium]|nr:MAG: DUF1801 domain-containing protein [Chloroflexota bacterium]